MINAGFPRLQRLRFRSPPPRRTGFTVLELAVALLVVVVLIALLLPVQHRGREPSRRTQCKSNLKQIALALHNYHDTYNVFPPTYTVDPDGKPLHSWRTLILPYLDQQSLYNKINLSKAWDDPANAEALQNAPHVYRCPSSITQADQTSYLAVVTANSCLRPAESRKLSEITDGTSNTVMIIEAGWEQAVPWMSPQDADETFLQSFGAESKEYHVGGRHAAMADGAVRFLSQKIDAKTLQALLTATGGETVGSF